MRRGMGIGLLCVGAAWLIVAAALGASAAPAGPAQDGFSVVMPLLGKNMVVDELPPLVGPTATPPPSATSAPTSTQDLPATITPIPSATPTAAVAGTISGRLTDGGDPMAYGMGDGFGPGLFLQRCAKDESELECDVIGRTGVVDDGRYEFRVPEGLRGGQYYQVVWFNENGMFGDFEVDGADLWLGVWYGPRIEEFSPGDEVDLADIELANFALTGPSHGTGYGGWPWLFTWDRWAGSGGTYRWSICDCCKELEERDRAWQSPRRAKPEYLVERMPPGQTVNTHYCWFVEVDAGEDVGYGETYHVWMLWWMPQLIENFEVVNPIDALRR